jgi:hypothetical protein
MPSSIARREKSTLRIVDGGACRRSRLERLDVPQPMCKTDVELELGGVSCDRAVSRGGMRTDGGTSQSKD